MANLWDKIKKGVVEGAYFAKEKSEELGKMGKKKLDILQIKRNITKNFSELGGLVYQAVPMSKDNKVTVTEEMKEIVEKIKLLEVDLEENENQFEILKNKETDKKEGK